MQSINDKIIDSGLCDRHLGEDRIDYKIRVDELRQLIIKETTPPQSTVEIRDYTDCFTVTINKEPFLFNGLSEPDVMKNLLIRLGIEFSYDEIANSKNIRN